MRHNLLRFWQLSRAEQQLLVQSGLLLTLTWVGLRLSGYRQVHSWLARLSQPAPPSLDARRQARIVALNVHRAAVRLPYASCLPRSLVLWGLLRRRGISADLHVGVNKEGDLFMAHAWVEYEGEVLNDHSNVRDRFAAFDRSLLPAQKRNRIS